MRDFGASDPRCSAAPQDSEFITPSPMGHGAGFVVEGSGSGGATGGTPRIVGLANSVTKFREDRRVSTRLTPFTERCAIALRPQDPRDHES